MNLIIYLYLGRRHVKDYRMMYNNQSVSLNTIKIAKD